MWKFVKSAVDSESFLNGHEKEICFIGRSNVGKSSLINTLMNRKLAYTSKTPGHTKLVNFFENNRQIFVDLPGYGFAKTSIKNKNKISKILNEYFTERKNIIIKVFLLIDSRIGFTPLDKNMIIFLKQNNLNFFILLTKLDKLLQKQKFKIKKEVEDITKDYLFVSSFKKKNISLLKEKIKTFFDF